MIKAAYDDFFKKISSQFSEDQFVISLMEDAEELAKYGERRVALENFLENILSSGVKIPIETISLAQKAFSDSPNDYDIELIEELQNLIKKNQ